MLLHKHSITQLLQSDLGWGPQTIAEVLVGVFRAGVIGKGGPIAISRAGSPIVLGERLSAMLGGMVEMCVCWGRAYPIGAVGWGVTLLLWCGPCRTYTNWTAAVKSTSPPTM